MPGMTLPAVYINGRFLAAKLTGVQRASKSLVEALDKELALSGKDRREWILLHPPEISQEIELKHIKPRAFGKGGGVLWEQRSLSQASKDGLLINLANSAPLTHPANIVMFHDAQVYSTPDSYSFAFRQWYKFMQPHVAQRAKAILTVSTFSAGQLNEYGVSGGRPVDVIHNGVDHFTGDAQSVSEPTLPVAEKGFFAAFASDAEHKNIAMLLKAFQSERLAGFGLALIGDKLPEGASVDGSRIRLLGRVPDSDMQHVFSHALALAFPSRTEGFGLPPLEAMASGCPVIAARAGALPEVCADAALLLSPDDPELWAKEMARLADDDALRTSLIAKGRERAALFTWSASARRLLSVIDRVTASA